MKVIINLCLLFCMHNSVHSFTTSHICVLMNALDIRKRVADFDFDQFPAA